MRLKHISIEGFRAFTNYVELNLDADVIVLQGPNGVGKTSLLDAILWCLTGTLERFSEETSPASVYSREGFARVALLLWDGQSELEVIRSVGSEKRSIRVRCGDEEFEGSLAEQKLRESLLPHSDQRSEGQRALDSVLTRGIYLQQDMVRQFVEEDSSTQRFALLSEVVGAGIVIEVQQWLERSRNSWSRTNTARRRDELGPLEKRLAQIDEQLSRLSESSIEQVEGVDARGVAESLHRRSVTLLGTKTIEISSAPESSSQLSRFLKELGAERAKAEREAIVASSLLEQSQESSNTDKSEEDGGSDLQGQEAKLEAEIAQLEKDFALAAREAAAERERFANIAQRSERRAALARLALDELGSHCPVCNQTYDDEITRRHLESMIADANDIAHQATSPSDLQRISRLREDASQKLQEIRSLIRQREDAVREAEARRSMFDARLLDAGIDPKKDLVEQLTQRRDKAMEVMTELDGLISEGENFSLRVLRVGEQRRREELSQERMSVSSQISDLRNTFQSLDKTHELAGDIINGLRGASLAVTQRQVEQIEPIFQRIYSRIDPHPTFRVTQLAASLKNGKGQLSLGVSDPDFDSDPNEPGPLLSSSQLNSYAVSLFLAMNLALPTVNFNVTILDDPLQSLDNLNLLGLVDVLRRFRAHRQIIVSTHEERLVGLLQRKLRPAREGERMITVLFEEWQRDGPKFKSIYSQYVDEEQRVLAA
ncbi:AAA family ATPase [Erythrobacter vulgaris]|uniref:AAA family ATPase n=1 Tax=Qipengyuania vulgaris TaxID=291985 RepID=A0A844XTB1_9SPHN|nr:AAA family ATPase [Qipengyuania vulgaris]MXO48639.1 AAA family ATPase [Qipengyuania vulgaris]